MYTKYHLQERQCIGGGKPSNKAVEVLVGDNELSRSGRNPEEMMTDQTVGSLMSRFTAWQHGAGLRSGRAPS
jgi:hypothetical protein